MIRGAAILSCCVAVAGCGPDEPGATEPPATPPDGGVAGCAAGERPLEDGSCQPAGVRPESCAPGFTPDDDRGCTPILPASPCEPGKMALPGETECREVAPCGDPPWGDIPVDAQTQYVDGSYAGLDSDGSARRPWTTIHDAVEAAERGAIIAIAAGSYPGDVQLFSKAVRLWGRCPALVEIVGAPDGLAAVDIRTGGDGTEVHTLAVTGGRTGIAGSGANGVVIDRVWAHDNGHAAVAAERTLGPGSLHIEGSLLENALEFGIISDSVDLTISRSVIRDSKPGPQGPGRGINLQTTVHDHVAEATVTGSLLERNSEIGIFVFASRLTLESSVIQDTRANERSLGGRGLNIEDDEQTGERSNVTVRASVLQRNRDIELTCTGCDLLVESTSLRDTRPMELDDSFGRCLSTLDRAGRSSVTLRESTITRCHDVGVLADGSDLILESVLIRDVRSHASDLRRGRGLAVQYGVITAERGNMIARWSVVDGVREFGVVNIGSDLTLEATLISNVAAAEIDGEFGDGVTLFTTGEPTQAWIRDSRIEATNRAGVSTFGGVVELSGSTLECNPIDLNAEPFARIAGAFLDAGDVVCGCAGAIDSCSVSTAMLAPPEPLDKR